MSKLTAYNDYLHSRLASESHLLADATQFLIDSHHCITTVLEARNVDNILSEYDVLRSHVFATVTDVYLISDATLTFETTVTAVDGGADDRDTIHIPSSWFVMWCTDKALWQQTYGKHVEDGILGVIEQKNAQAQEALHRAQLQVDAVNEAATRIEQEQQIQQAEETHNNQP